MQTNMVLEKKLRFLPIDPQAAEEVYVTLARLEHI